MGDRSQEVASTMTTFAHFSVWILCGSVSEFLRNCYLERVGCVGEVGGDLRFLASELSVGGNYRVAWLVISFRSEFFRSPAPV